MKGCTHLLIALVWVALTGGAYAQTPYFTVQTVHEAESPIFALAAGDLGEGNGLQALYLAETSDVFRLDPRDWSVELIFAGEDEVHGVWRRPTLDIGDFSEVGPGIVSTAGLTHITALHRADNGWEAEHILDLTGMIGFLWGARAGDYDPSRPGDEILVIHETVMDFSIALLYWREDGAWQSEIIYMDEVGMDSAVGDFDPNHDGPEIVIPTEMGVTYALTPPGSDWTEERWPKRTLWEHYPEDSEPDDSGWVVKIANVDPDRPGNEVIYGTRYNNRVVISYPDESGDGHVRERIFRGRIDYFEEPGTMNDIAVGHVFPGSTHAQIAAVDDSGALYLIWKEEGVWRGELLWEDDEALYAVEIADFDPSTPGDEILVAGESGKAHLLRFAEPSSAEHWALYE